MIDKVQPVQEAFKYWNKYKKFARSCINNCQNYPELKEELDSELYLLFKRLIESNSPSLDNTYRILKRLRWWTKRFIKYQGYHKLEHTSEYGDVFFKGIPDKTNLDITIDDYLLKEKILWYVNRLPEDERVIVSMYYGLGGYERKDTVQIGEVLNKFPNWISCKLNRAYKRLKAWLKSRGYNNIGDYING